MKEHNLYKYSLYAGLRILGIIFAPYAAPNDSNKIKDSLHEIFHNSWIYKAKDNTIDSAYRAFVNWRTPNPGHPKPLDVKTWGKIEP